MRRLLPLAALFVLATLAGCGASGPKELQVTVTEKGFEPENLVVRRGGPAVVVFTRKTDRTCATEALFVETGRKYDLPMNTPVRVDLTGVSSDTLHYACGMNMYKGTIRIE